MTTSATYCAGCGRSKGCEAYQFNRYWHLPCLLKERERRARAPRRTRNPYSIVGLAGTLRSLNEAWDHEVAGPSRVALDYHAVIVMNDEPKGILEPRTSSVEIPGRKGFDAMRAARQLLAFWRDMRDDLAAGRLPLDEEKR